MCESTPHMKFKTELFILTQRRKVKENVEHSRYSWDEVGYGAQGKEGHL